jgi:hypothetical protein
MKKCSHCSKRIAFGGESLGTEAYCNKRCLKAGLLAAADFYLTEDIIQSQIDTVHKGPCPKCQGEGPNDLQSHYLIWSIILLTSHKEVSEVCCKSCGIKKKVGGLAFSTLCGWWGFPFGLILTPVQMIRNIGSLFQMPKLNKVSKQLTENIRMHLGAEAVLEKVQLDAQEMKAAETEIQV